MNRDTDTGGASFDVSSISTVGLEATPRLDDETVSPWRPLHEETGASWDGPFARDIEAGYAYAAGEIGQTRREGEVIGDERALSLLALLVSRSELPVRDPTVDFRAAVKLAAAGFAFVAADRLLPSVLGIELVAQLQERAVDGGR